MTPLPIDPLLPEIVGALRRGSSLVLEAPPGAGKTTRVPRALDDAGVVDGQILVLEPRRLAARLAAARLADERGEPLGESVGYRVRFEEVAGPRARIVFVTEGLLLRRLLDDPRLDGVGAILCDEFHERHLQGDLALALGRRIQRARPSLKLAAMSATLEAAPLARYLGDCPSLRGEGRRFDVALEYAERPPAPDRPLESDVAQAVRKLIADGLDGDVLVFLPGAAEIRRAAAACAPLAEQHGLDVATLHGDLPPAEQDRAIKPGARRKIILSTNVAETSVTIEGVVAVIDSGLARVAAHSPWSGLPTLRVQRISRASATQRAGRAGRLRPGRCLRLYTRHDHDTRPAQETPEVRRSDLAEAVLLLAASGERDAAAFDWFESPPDAALDAARALLARLGALDGSGALTDLGRRMLRFPVHPRLARLVVEAERRGAGREGCVVAALVGEQELARNRGPAKVSGPSDLGAELELFAEAERVRLQPDRVRALGLDVGATLAVDRVRRQLQRELKNSPRPPEKPDLDAALGLAVLAGYPDRVARRRKPGARELVLSGGGTARLADSSVVDAELLVAVDAEERASAGRAGSVLVRRASAVEPEWLIDLYADRLREVVEHPWNAEAERVEVVRKLVYDQLTLDEKRAPARPDAPGADAEAIARALAAAALDRGPRAFTDGDALERFLGRLEFVRAACPELNAPAVGDAELRAALEALCAGASSFAELRERNLVEALRARLDGSLRRQLDELAPERVTLPGGRAARITYTPGQPPSVASRLQNFFGLREGPRVARGRVALTLHLLAPNQRAVQVTSDLAGFWQRHYPSIRRELMRRYPRHAWPEDPLAARPPSRT
ncbi:MAG TPA: ATP-dependent helicase HrpB [Polyangia bacterium]|nr:ATP-dependent helicase HrpB [Polyangia bacterium]